jgi:uracil-DNA glycosylase family 4
MAREQDIGPGAHDLKAQLADWLRLVELSGTREVLMVKAELRGPDRAATDGAAGEGESLHTLEQRLGDCRRCGLHGGRTNMVFGEGDPASDIMFVGEGPGMEEDRSGRPFVGRAGALLTKIIQAMGLERENVYITNIVKCRPPGNRDPEPDEISECLPYLEEQIDIIKPRVICALGRVAAQTLLAERGGISSLRGRFFDYRGIKLMPTFHPAACLRQPSNKRLVWEDIKQIMSELGLPIRGVMTNGPSKDKH